MPPGGWRVWEEGRAFLPGPLSQDRPPKTLETALSARRIVRVAADPPVPADASEPGGWPGLGYYRLHGSPRTYWSSYTPEQIAAHAARLRGESWTIYDNTASGAAAGNALDLQALV